MKLSTRARYGLRICFLMAVSEEKVTLPQIVSRTDLSKKYLEQILSMLKKGGIIETYRGMNGGYSLTRSPNEITVKQVLEAVGDSFEITDCVSGTCSDIYCPNRKIFKKLYDSIDGILTSTTLRDMVDDNRRC